ncbi:hypothetical protein [Pseudomonas cichorii]|uniref:DNA-binding protein n=1 Tax=Pseudomonas cichorii TaxID=36746 RepID=A0ABQ1DIK3_PSECI|nr:hypothetical protein [Pseudomonas cichorii]GFM90832.1 hypothetical protein PSCICP_08040 [Pseudomonas cichorii]
MATAENLHEDAAHDKVTEKRMAELVGCTAKALQRKREKGIIPKWVWMKIDGRIMYSKRRYEEWIESLWTCRPGSSLSGDQSEFASPGTRGAAARRSPSPRPRKELQQQRVYVLK